jgi:hypothetical protein
MNNRDETVLNLDNQNDQANRDKTLGTETLLERFKNLFVSVHEVEGKS